MATAQNQVYDDSNGFESAEAEKINTPSQQSSSGTVVNGATPSSSSPTTQNPLGNLSSYTYGLSLYMVNTDVTNQFIAGGGSMAGITGSTRGVRVVAQSGGFSETDNPLRALGADGKPGVKIEYYIDDLNLTTYLPGGPQKATASTEIKFKINEPYGFTFLQDLTRAGYELNKEGKVNAPNMNGIQQHFIIGIKFYGYDVDGKVITQVPSNPKGDSPDGELPERFFAIRITKVKFKLDGRMVSYQCEAVVMSESIANGQVNGILKSATTLTGSTVWDVLANPGNKNSLISVLNASTQADKDSNKVKIPTIYSIEFLDANKKVVDKDSVIGKSKLVNDATFDATLASTFKVSSAEKSTIAQQFKAVSIDGNKASIAQPFGQTILTIIDNIITKSEYVSRALNEVSTPGAETASKTQTASELKWYTVNPVITAKGFDEKTNDWAYEIKFQITEYEVPYVRTVNATNVSTYNGPSKKYDYWLTGSNSEIISYEQSYDNLFYMMTVASRSEAPDEKPKGSVPVKVQNSTGGDANGSQNKQFQFNQNVAAQMYSPGDQAQARIRIMGDPDYIMSVAGVNYSKALGKNKVGIDPLKGQVFIEITFLMATDYGENGLLNVSGNIQFYDSDIITALNIKGVVYKVYKVDSVFSKGSFTQTLSCLLVDQRILSNVVDNGKNKLASGTQGSGSDRETTKPNPNVTAETLKRANVPANMIGRQGGNAGGKPYTDPRESKVTPSTVLNSNQSPSSTSSQKPTGPWKSIVENNGDAKRSFNTSSDDMFLATKPQGKYTDGTRGGR